MLPFDFKFQGAGRALRGPRIEALAASSWKDTLDRQGRARYAGDDENAREVPYRTLYSMREGMQDNLDAIPDDGSHIPSNALFFAFCDQQVSMPVEQVIPVPREDLWWLATSGDLLLLSDKVTTHYATMLHASAETGRMALVDEWPDRIFLREGFNEKDVCARVNPFFGGVFDSVEPGKKEVSVTRDEFLRVAVGLVTLDTPALLHSYLARRPELREDARAMLSFGLALMTPAHDAVARFAAPYLARAEELFAAAGENDKALESAACSYAAHLIAVLVQMHGRERFAVAPFAAEAKALEQRHGKDTLISGLDVELLIRLGNAAAVAGQYPAAFEWLDLAVVRDPFHDAAHWLRAKVRQFQNEPVEQVADATEALARNAAWIERRRAEHMARDPRDYYGRLDIERRIGGLETRRHEELMIRAVGLVMLGRLDEASADAEAARKLRPEASGPHRQLGFIAHTKGDIDASRSHFEAALAHAAGGPERAMVRRVMASLGL
jgi:tetratricopeptide (TPR) repeat protein